MNDIYREPSFWSVIPDCVLSATNIKANAKLLYAKVTSLQSARGYCFATNKYLAEGLGIAPDTVTRLLKDLSDAGYLRLEIIKGTDNQIVERRIFPTITLPIVSPPSRINVRDPIGQISDTPIGQTSEERINTENKEEIPPIAPQGASRRKTKRSRPESKKEPDHKPERFKKFWEFYPRGESKQDAIRAWDKLKPSDDLINQMAKALKKQTQTDEWKRGIGIPYASTWLNKRKWEDEVKEQPTEPLPDARGGLEAW